MKNKLNNMTKRQSKDNLTKSMKYSKKFAAGKIIGLQNILPVFADHAELVYFTDN